MTAASGARTALLGPGAFRLFLSAVVVLAHLSPLALGAWAVDVFFVLSGYWVSAMWTERYSRTRAPYLTFVVSRFWRLWPLYITCTALVLALIYSRGRMWADVVEKVSSPEWVARVLLLVSSAAQPVALQPAWSLDIEMQFYLVLPLFCAALAWLSGWRATARALVALAFAAGAAALLVPGAAPGLANYLIFFWSGMLLYRTRWNPGAGAAWLSLLGALAVAAALFLLPGAAHDMVAGARGAAVLKGMNHRVCGVLALMVIPFAAHNVRVPTGALDHHLGQLSYAVYLWHWIPMMAVEMMLEPRGVAAWVRWSAELGAIFLGAALLYWGFDRPIDAWRRRWVRSRLA